MTCLFFILEWSKTHKNIKRGGRYQDHRSRGKEYRIVKKSIVFLTVYGHWTPFQTDFKFGCNKSTSTFISKLTGTSTLIYVLHTGSCELQLYVEHN